MARVDISHPIDKCAGNAGGHESSPNFVSWESPMVPDDQERMRYATYNFCQHCSCVVAFKIERDE